MAQTMKLLEGPRRLRRTYQIRLNMDLGLRAASCFLTNEIWRALDEREFTSRRWLGLFGAVDGVIRTRMARDSFCGHRPRCGTAAPRALYDEGEGRPLPPHIRLLELKGDAGRLARLIAAAAARRFRADGSGRAERNRLSARLERAVRLALLPYFYYSEPCQTCPMGRELLRRRKQWGEYAEER